MLCEPSFVDCFLDGKSEAELLHSYAVSCILVVAGVNGVVVNVYVYSSLVNVLPLSTTFTNR